MTTAKYRRDNRVKILKAKRIYRQKYKAQIAAYMRLWRQRNKEKRVEDKKRAYRKARQRVIADAFIY